MIERHHPLILIGIFIVVFLAIHPFKDGNGRLSRILTTLLLLRAGYGYVPYSSMEGIVEANKDNYYLALRRTQQTIRKEKQNWEYWLVFFLKTMSKQKDKPPRSRRSSPAIVLARPFAPDTGARQDPRRNHAQGNRGFDGGEPQHHQSAYKETGHGTIPNASRQRPRRTVYLEIDAVHPPDAASSGTKTPRLTPPKKANCLWA